MKREQVELAIQYDRGIRKIDDTLEVLSKPMTVISSQLTGHVIKFSSLDNDTARLLKTAMIDTLEARKQELKEKLEEL